MNNHVSLSFKQKKNGELIPFATGVHDGIGGHATLFANLPVTLVALLAAIADFTNKFNASIKGSVAQTQDREDARVVLIGLLSQLAAYVEGIAQGNADTIRAAGFEVTAHEQHAQAVLTQPEITASLSAGSGQVQLRVKTQPNVHSVNVRHRIPAGPWQDGGSFPSSRAIIVPNLTPGQLYEFEVQFVGGSTGRTDWSDYRSHMAT